MDHKFEAILVAKFWAIFLRKGCKKQLCNQTQECLNFGVAMAMIDRNQSPSLIIVGKLWLQKSTIKLNPHWQPTVEVYQTSAKEIMARLTFAVVMFGVNLTSSLTLKSL